MSKSFAVGDKVRIIGSVVESNFIDNDDDAFRGVEATISRDRKNAPVGFGRWCVWFDDSGEWYAFVEEASIEHVQE